MAARAGLNARNEPVPLAAPDLTMYWSIFMLDLGFVVAAAVAAAIGLMVGARWARAAVFGIVGWFALVPPSVAAMALVKVLRDDPNAATVDTLVYVLVTTIFWVVAGLLFRRLSRGSSWASDLRASVPQRASG